jgi:hypothetical protein
MKKLIIFSLISFFWACSPEELISPYPCLDGDCGAYFEIDPLVSPGVYQDNNGYWHIEHQGFNYFTIKGQLDELHPDYVVNGVPLVETVFDSDYWVWINGITFTVPLYSVLGYFTGGGYLNPIPVGNLTYTIEDMAQNHPPLNITGYQINKNQCLDCPYSETLIGTYSKYNYTPQQQIFFDNEMVGDTAKVFIKSTFNSDLGQRVEIEKEFKIVFE